MTRPGSWPKQWTLGRMTASSRVPVHGEFLKRPKMGRFGVLIRLVLHRNPRCGIQVRNVRERFGLPTENLKRIGDYEKHSLKIPAFSPISQFAMNRQRRGISDVQSRRETAETDSRRSQSEPERRKISDGRSRFAVRRNQFLEKPGNCHSL